MSDVLKIEYDLTLTLTALLPLPTPRCRQAYHHRPQGCSQAAALAARAPAADTLLAPRCPLRFPCCHRCCAAAPTAALSLPRCRRRHAAATAALTLPPCCHRQASHSNAAAAIPNALLPLPMPRCCQAAAAAAAKLPPPPPRLSLCCCAAAAAASALLLPPSCCCCASAAANAALPPSCRCCCQAAEKLKVSIFHLTAQYQMKWKLSLYWGVFNILNITTTTHNDIVCISFNSKSTHSNSPNIFIYAERGQSQLSNGIRVWGSWTESS
jgi:hypothetical protein